MESNDRFDRSALSRLGNQAHVRWVHPEHIAGCQAREDFFLLLDREERERHNRLRFASDRANYFAAHVLLRLTLSQYVDLPPSAWRFRREVNGRPEIANDNVPPLRFNLTHTEGLSACVVTLTDDCGIDAERLYSRHELTAVARRMFSPAEVRQMEHLEGDRRLEYFYDRWTLREAYVKARGTGIFSPTRSIEFDIDADGRIKAQFRAELRDDGQHWQFKLLRLGSRHVISVALASRKTIVARQFGPQGIIPRLR